MGYKAGIKIARSTLGYIAMEDELRKRMELALGEIRSVGGSSKTRDTSKKNQKKVEILESDFQKLSDSAFDPRQLEILAGKLVQLCADIIEDNAGDR